MNSIYEKKPRCRSSEFSVLLVFSKVVYLKIVANRCEEVVVVAGGCLFVKLVPKVKPPCSCQGLAATAEDRKSVAVFFYQSYRNVCLCHGVFLSVVGALPPPCLRSVVQADALEVVVAFADFRVVCLDRLAVVGSLLFLFFASHANHLGVEH